MLKLHFKRPENFLRSFYREHVCFSIWFGFWGKIIRNLTKFSYRIVKSAIYLSRGTLWRKYCWLFEINFDLGRENFGFSAKNWPDCYQMSTICFQLANWKNIFLRTSREQFLVFSLNHFRQGDQNCISHAKRNIPIRKNISTKLFYRFWKMREFFLNFHWNILDMVVKITVFVFRGALWEKFPTRREFFLDFHRTFFGMVVKLTVYVLRGALWERLSFSNFSKLLSELHR